MGVIKVTGVVIRSVSSGENDRRVVILTESGKVFATARGARKPKSKFKETSVIFAFADFVLFDGGGFHTYNTADLIDGFFNITRDYERYTAACACLALCESVFYEGMSAGSAPRFLTIALRALDGGGVPPKLPLAAFVFRVLRQEGFLSGAGQEGLFDGLSQESLSLLEYILDGKKTKAVIDDRSAGELYGAAAALLFEQTGIELKC